MYLKNLTMNGTEPLSDRIKKAGELIEQADKIVVGIGAGLSAAGGLNYADEALMKKWYPEFYSLGIHTIMELQGRFWYLPNCKPEQFWAVWAQHIFHIRYETGVTEPYRDLYRILAGKDYFICTTNVDSQCEKAGFSPEWIFAMQGNYGYFQCSVPCSDELYDNHDSILRMVQTMPSPFEILPEEVPKCPKCGAPLIPNLRCDGTFVEEPHLKNLPAYREFLEQCKGKKTVFLELGVGFNTPGIIKYPFWHMVSERPESTYICANLKDAGAPGDIAERAVCLNGDIADVLKAM